MMFKPYPWHRFEIISPLSPADARKALEAHIEEEKWLQMRWPSRKNDDRFAGSFAGDTFSVHRILGYRNSWAPVTEGRIEAAGRGSRIDVKMNIHPIILAFTACLVVALAMGFMAITRLWPLGLVGALAFYGVITVAFWWEAGRQERTLREIFKAGAG